MAKKLNLYKGEELVKSVDASSTGASKVLIEGLTPNTDFKAGDYKVSFSNSGGESIKVDVPSFKTLAILVNSITIENKEVALKIGETSTISATVAPENATDTSLVYSSSDDTIASVDTTGKITGVAVGTAKITVASKDKGASADVSVTVSENPPTEPTNVTVDPSEESATVSAE